MPVDIIGMITATPGAEVDVPGGAAVQPDYVRRFAQAHEAAGFDQIPSATSATRRTVSSSRRSRPPRPNASASCSRTGRA